MLNAAWASSVNVCAESSSGRQNSVMIDAWREARLQLGHCRSMAKEEFADGVKALKGLKIVQRLRPFSFD